MLGQGVLLVGMAREFESNSGCHGNRFPPGIHISIDHERYLHYMIVLLYLVSVKTIKT